MPELSEISYCRDVTIRAFRGYYRFLVELYIDDSRIVELLEGGWPTISPEFQQFLGKQMSLSLKMMSEGGMMSENVPSHVIGLTFGNHDNPVFLLDTKLGIVYWPEWDGGRDPRNDSHVTFIEPIWDDIDLYAPENEHEWRGGSQAWTITDFFELLKTYYRTLNWIPINSREVVDTSSAYDICRDVMVPIIQGIFREHGWSLEQEEAHYRKRECLKAVKRALTERYPDPEDLFSKVGVS